MDRVKAIYIRMGNCDKITNAAILEGSHMQTLDGIPVLIFNYAGYAATEIQL